MREFPNKRDFRIWVSIRNPFRISHPSYTYQWLRLTSHVIVIWVSNSEGLGNWNPNSKFKREAMETMSPSLVADHFLKSFLNHVLALLLYKMTDQALTFDISNSNSVMCALTWLYPHLLPAASPWGSTEAQTVQCLLLPLRKHPTEMMTGLLMITVFRLHRMNPWTII